MVSPFCNVKCFLRRPRCNAKSSAALWDVAKVALWGKTVLETAYAEKVKPFQHKLRLSDPQKGLSDLKQHTTK